MRIGGLASGMDTEQMVRDLMRVERMRIDRFLQQEQRAKWRQEAYNNINRKMADFILDTRKAFGLTRVTNTGSLQSGSVNSFDWVKQANSSHENIVRTTASANAMSGTHRVEVEQLAEVASVSSQDIRELLDENRRFKADGEITITSGIDDEAKVATIQVTKGDSINSFITSINNAVDNSEGPNKGKSLGLRAGYDASLNQFMITSRNTGEEQKIVIGANDLGSKMFATDPDEVEGNTVIEATGANAKIRFNGSEVSRSSNNFSIYGINLQLQSAKPETEVTINVDTDVDGIFNKISDFVNSYNELLDSINGLTGEKFHRDFPPLTDEQKEAMSERDIEQWEERAKSGLLRNDEVLNRTTQTMRSSLYQTVYSDKASESKLPGYSHITEVGITTGNYQSGGRLEINEERLRRAINENPEAVLDLFFKTPASSATAENKKDETGLVQRLYDDLIGGMKEVIRRSGPGEDSAVFRNVQSNMLIDFVTTHSSISRIDRELMQINQRVAREEQILARREERYWQQFTAMEKALSQMYQQSDWLMAQMYGGQ